MLPAENCPCPAHPARTSAAMGATRVYQVDITAPPLRQSALPEDDEPLAVGGDAARHLARLLVNDDGPPAIRVGALQHERAVRMVHVPDGRLPALLRFQVADLHGLGVDLEDRREVDVLRRARLAPAPGLAFGHCGRRTRVRSLPARWPWRPAAAPCSSAAASASAAVAAAAPPPIAFAACRRR